MSDENKDRAEEKEQPGEGQLNEDKLDKVSGGVTTSRSDGGGATVGRANFDVFTVTKLTDQATTTLG